MEELTPKEIVKELDKFVIGQNDAKRAVAISLRNRWRRQRVDEGLRDEIMPKNTIMVGPTGVGKTEIAKRLSSIAQSPFIKVEASKFTEVGYVGRDVESIIRDLTELAVNEVRSERTEQLTKEAELKADDKILAILVPPPFRTESDRANEPDDSDDLESELDDGDADLDGPEPDGNGGRSLSTEAARPTLQAIDPELIKKWERTREKMRARLARGDFDDTEIDIDVRESIGAVGLNILSSSGFEEMGIDMKSIISSLPFPTEEKLRREKVSKAREILTQQELQRLVDMDSVVKDAIERVEETGIVFLDEIDKIVGNETFSGPDVSRQGVQRDILPIVEGTTVLTKYGMVRTDHILFIAAGAFHNCKVSDLIPELQGRFPITVHLSSLGKDEFARILTEPENALIKQYRALLAAEGIGLRFTKGAVDEISEIAETVNIQHEDIGARRLHTVVDELLDEVSFNAPELKTKKIVVNAKYVREKVGDLAEKRDLSEFIL
ncbi:ATP-dependent protease ATPase subunit HslU [bacterium]|nr:ATP-dependent protease ATPase subunit HslU [bacterium]